MDGSLGLARYLSQTVVVQLNETALFVKPGIIRGEKNGTNLLFGVNFVPKMYFYAAS